MLKENEFSFSQKPEIQVVRGSVDVKTCAVNEGKGHYCMASSQQPPPYAWESLLRYRDEYGEMWNITTERHKYRKVDCNLLFGNLWIKRNILNCSQNITSINCHDVLFYCKTCQNAACILRIFHLWREWSPVSVPGKLRSIRQFLTVKATLIKIVHTLKSTCAQTGYYSLTKIHLAN